MKFSSYSFLLILAGMLLVPLWGNAQTTEVSVLVRSAEDVSPIQQAEISYFDLEGRKIRAGSTNSAGYLRFTAAIPPGKNIIVVAGKQGEFSVQQVERTLKHPDEDPNHFNFYLRVFDGLKVRGHVYDATSQFNRPVPGALITVPNSVGGKDTVRTDPSGYFEFNTLIKSGRPLPFRIEKGQYLLLEQIRTLQVEGPGHNVFDFRITPVPKMDWEKTLYWGSGGCALISIGSYLLADVNYDNYKDFSNLEREDDYKRANSWNRVCIVSGGLALMKLGGALYFRHRKKKDLRAQNISTNGLYGQHIQPQIGLSPTGDLLVGIQFDF